MQGGIMEYALFVMNVVLATVIVAELTGIAAAALGILH